MWKVTLRGLAANKIRLALTALAIVLGVGFVSGTFVLTDTMRRVFDDLFADAYAGVDVVIRTESGSAGIAPGMDERDPVPAELVEVIRAVEGVAVAEGTAEGYAQLVDPGGEAIAPMAPALGFSWPPDTLNPFTLRQGSAPTSPEEVIIDARTAEEHGFQVGDPVTVLLIGGPESFVVSGIAGFGAADNLAGATLAAFEPQTALRVLGIPEGHYSQIEVAASPGVATSEVRNGIAAVLPEGIEAVTTDDLIVEFGESLDQGMAFFRTALFVFALVALFVGGFIIANTFSIVVTQRTREYAMLRAVGASSGQVVRAVVGEGMAVGAVAGVAGVGLGVLLAVGLRALLGVFGLALPAGGLVVLPRTVVVGLVVALGVTLVSVLVPARRAARVEPLAALRAVTAPPRSLSRRRVIAGAVLLVAGGALMAGGSLAIVGVGALVVFLGVAMLSPLVTRPLGRALGAPGARMGMTGKLARENVARDPRRTAATASALMIGLALVSFVAILADSLKSSMSELVGESFRADFMIETPLAQAGPAAGFSPSLTQELRERPEVAVVSAQRIGFWREDESVRIFAGIEPATFPDVTGLEIVEGDLQGLDAGGLLVTTDQASDRGLGVGDRLEMEFPRTGPTSLEIVATFEPMPEAGVDYLVSMQTYEALSTNRLDQFVAIGIVDGVEAEQARAAIEGVTAAHPNVVVRDRQELVADREANIDQLLALVSVLLLLAIIIALLGITNTLALSVFERTREIGLLRAVGMSRGQTRAMIRWEALVVALLGAVMGVIVGIVFGWVMTNAIDGIRVFSVPGGQLLTYAVVAGIAGVLAGVLPSRRAARLDVLEAIATE